MKDQFLFSITIEQLLHQRIGKGLGSNIVLSTQIKEYIDLFSFPLRVDAVVLLVCTKGSLNLTINLTEQVVTTNNYGISLPENVIGFNSVSDDFEGYILLLSMDYLRKLSIDFNDLLPYYVYVRNNPTFSVAPSNIETIIRYFELLSSLIEAEDTKRKNSIIDGFIISLINKLAEDFDYFALKTIQVKTKSKEYYYMRFVELLQQNFKQHHKVGFYAERLSLTPKYLSTLMKEVSGLSAPQWINDYIVVEAKTLLKFSDMNIMEISDYLNFPNQSFFSKYFKQHTGLTPKQYRSN
ncbi:AraC family transcriptional regulator [Puteibacter caeruleilacunae]|nr:AraC family transcriptional regulator [Puteibacter caeruleilacunae]